MPAMFGPVLGRRWEASSPPIFIGAGFSSSIFRSAFWACTWRRALLKTTRKRKIAPLDWPGFILSALGCSLLMMGLATSGRHLVSGDISLLLRDFRGAVVWMVYVWHARRTAHPPD